MFRIVTCKYLSYNNKNGRNYQILLYEEIGMRRVPRLINVKLNKISRTHRRKSIRSTISSLSKIYIEDKFSSPKDKPIVLPNPKKKPKKRKNKRIKGLVIKNKRD